jgi:hypothetical protein
VLRDKTVTFDTPSDLLEQLLSLFVLNDWVVERSENKVWQVLLPRHGCHSQVGSLEQVGWDLFLD